MNAKLESYEIQGTISGDNDFAVGNRAIRQL